MKQDYRQNYRDTFERLGRKLNRSDGVSQARLVAAERRLGCKIPKPLGAFYSVAGRARDFTDRHDHFRRPDEWTLEAGKLVFLEENQAVVLYGVDTRLAAPDPPVVMASNAEPYVWHKVCARCSEFLCVMVHWEGAFAGAMTTGGSAIVAPRIRRQLERGLTPVGEVNRMWAYSRKGLAVCLVRWTDGWRVFVGADDEAALKTFSAEFGVKIKAA
jgi:hypothetical protein